MLPADELHKLLASDDVNVPDEETIFHALMMWVKYDMQRRCGDLSMLLAYIRLPLLPPQVNCLVLLNTIFMCFYWNVFPFKYERYRANNLFNYLNSYFSLLMFTKSRLVTLLLSSLYCYNSQAY